jgi:predicted kinase
VRLVLVGGLPGTGKSTLAAALGPALGATVLRSDVVRKELAGLDPDQGAAARYGQGIYTPVATTATYDELLARARSHLVLGESVVLDASWSRAEPRTAARIVAADTDSDLVELRCEVPTDLAAARLAARAERGGDPSDADAAIAAAMAATADPWPEATAIDTTAPPDVVAAAALRLATGQG